MKYYKVMDKKFNNPKTAIEYAFSIVVKRNMHNVSIDYIEEVTEDFMGVTSYDIIDKIVIKGPASYQIDALNKNWNPLTKEKNNEKI